MNRICWSLVDITSRMLEPEERDAVLGDFFESGETGGQALCGLLGLILRRQAALWKDWRPWLVLLSFVLPLAWLLSIAARLTAGISAVYLWSYLNNWDWTLLRYASFWYILRDAAIAVSTQCMILICWSWSAGFLLGSVSRRMVPTNALLFCLISIVGQLVGASRYLDWFVSVVPRPQPSHPDPVSALLVYRDALPVIVIAALVVIPAIWAMRQGTDLHRLRKPVRIGLVIAAALTVLAMTIRQPGLGFFLRAHRQLAILHGWPTRLLQLVVYWPVAYLIVRAIGKRRHVVVYPA